jgi:hypothetical protein
MSIDQRRPSSPRYPLPRPETSASPNTVVVLPKPLPMNRSALWILFWSVGVLMGLFARTVIDGPEGLEPAAASGGNGMALAAGNSVAPPTMEVQVRAVLELPSPTPTSTPESSPTAMPDQTRTADFCSAAEPGKLCRVPYPPPPTPTPYPSCADMDRLSPGNWCIWPTPAESRS